MRDHHGLDAAFESMDKAYSAGDALETGRASAAFNFHLAIHLEKEDEHLYCLVKKLVPAPERIKALNIMSGTMPQENFPESQF